MTSHKTDLLKKWSEKKDLIDHQALKEMKNDFEATHKQMNYMVSEWDKRKLSNILSDFLADLVTEKFEEYWKEYKVMEEVKRNEAAALRMKNQKLEEYKREKRRDIPSWPESLPYNKFKPDLGWDKEHYLTTPSVKFGLLEFCNNKKMRIRHC